MNKTPREKTTKGFLLVVKFVNCVCKTEDRKVYGVSNDKTAFVLAT